MRKSGDALKHGAMARHPRYDPAFDLDVLAAAEWYAKASRKLAVDFTVKVEKAVEEILGDPARRSLIDFGLRYWPIERFPHIVFYDFTETEVYLIGVMHPSQRPDDWIARRG